jgi:phosphoribosylformylglycinamidine synthase
MADGKILQSAHDCSDGGLAVALAECCMTGLTHEGVFQGVKATLPGKGRMDARLFGEAQSRAIVSCNPSAAGQVETLAKKFGIPCEKLGQVGGDVMILGNEINVPVAKLADLFFTSTEKRMA